MNHVVNTFALLYCFVWVKTRQGCWRSYGFMRLETQTRESDACANLRVTEIYPNANGPLGLTHSLDIDFDFDTIQVI